MPLYLSGGCAFQKDQPILEHFSLGRCGLSLAAFGLTTIASLIGVYIPDGEIAFYAPLALLIFDTAISDFVGMVQAWTQVNSNPLGLVIAFAQILYDVGIQILQKVLLQIMSGGFFQELGALIEIGSDAIPAVLGAKLVLAVGGALIGIAGLASDRCLPGM